MRKTSGLSLYAAQFALLLVPSFMAATAVSNPAAAWDSDFGEGCCPVPPELIGRASALEQSFSSSSAVDLARQSWAGQI
ncbi:MAG: hypothetical protein Q8J78_14900, partial [Moraxellaceae bacterium]|nr:hypothetical protein [Moraxellaceae bacterium]